MDKAPEYNRWTKDALIKRIQALEAEKLSLQQNASSTPQPQGSNPEGGAVTAADDVPAPKPVKKKPDRKIDPSKYSTRLVAFKLAYLGKAYGGFEFQASAALSTIEEELWKALVKACLIFPENPDEVRFEAWDYSKCGRTDRGVSAFGQVIGVRVRSNRPLPKKRDTVPEEGGQDGTSVTDETSPAQQKETEEELPEEKPFDDHTDEIQYCRILNRLLPPDIRILAWCPNIPTGFSARHECRERQYRYFFTQPAYSPVPGSLENPKASAPGGVKDGWLDIDAMRAAAKKYEGAHDFRNFCKVDPGKLITNFVRRIFECDVVEVKDAATALPHLNQEAFRSSHLANTSEESFPKVYYFHVRGSAFLWHQIRCMVAVLFAVGQGLEPPPEYPLVLWDCVFPDLSITDAPGADPAAPKVDTMDWVYVGEDNPLAKHGVSGLVDQLWQGWRERKMDEILAGQLLSLVTPGPAGTSSGDIAKRLDRKRVFEGGDRDRIVGKYVPLLQKDKLAAPEDTYDKEARRKGYQDADDWRAARAKKWEGIPRQFDRPAVVEEGDE
ncbi:pseudouridine synthase [Apiospora hydei]|uniref:Pseudouridine synthase n=1 Tax=Apiospora hydei TaxID=1337664 RepID=A0ABR1XAM3_9PEZI